MMKNYHLVVFSQDNCKPCTTLKEHVATLDHCSKAELDFVPFKKDGQRTALAEELNIEFTPTLVVLHDDITCMIDDQSGDEFCDQIAEPVERFVGAKAIIKALPSTLDSYTYCEVE